MFRLIRKNHVQVGEDTPDRLVIHTSPRHSVLFDVQHQKVTFLYARQPTKTIAFDEIMQVYLDYQEETYTEPYDPYWPRQRIRRRWVIFLALKNGETITVTDVTTLHSLGESASLTKQNKYWDGLATKIANVIRITLIRMPSVPGGPHTFVESIEQILQHHLARSPLRGRSVQLRSGTDGILEIEVDGIIYGALDEVEDKDIRDLIQASVDEWQALG